MPGEFSRPLPGCERFDDGQDSGGDRQRLPEVIRSVTRKPNPEKEIPMAPSRGPHPLARSLHKTLAGHKGPVHVVKYAQGTAKYILSGGQDRTVRLWNPHLGTEIKAFTGHGYEVLSVSVYVTLPSVYSRFLS